jgi:hypothetical protein
MTTPQLNVLLDTAVQRCQELATEAGDAASAASAVAQEVLELAKFVEQDGQDLHQELQKAIAAVNGAASRVTATADDAVAKLEGVPGRAAETAHAVGGLILALRQQASELDAAREGLLDGLRTAVDAANEDYRALAQGLDEYLERVARAFLEAGSGVRELATETLHLGQIIGHRASQVRQDVEQLGTAAEEHAAELARAMDHGSQEISNHVTTVLNETMGAHNALAQELHTGVAGPSWVEETLAPLEAALGSLCPVPDQVEESLFPPLSAIGTSAERTMGDLESAADALGQARR